MATPHHHPLPVEGGGEHSATADGLLLLLSRSRVVVGCGIGSLLSQQAREGYARRTQPRVRLVADAESGSRMVACHNRLPQVELSQERSQGIEMSIFDRLFGWDKADYDGTKPEISLTSEAELAAIEGGAVRSVVLASGERGAAFANALVPVAANAAQAAQTYGMAVNKFPEGVGWADLCVRRSDGWNLLSNFKDSKFNEMAAIRQVGLQPVAVANLALQGAAVLVGQAYMAQINDKLEGLSDGIAEIQRSMESGREAELESHFDALERVVLMFDKHGFDQSKRTVALQVVEDATKAAQQACHYEAKAMRGIGAGADRRGKMPKRDVEGPIRRLRKEEGHASVAFQLLVVARQTGMRLECDYTNARIEKELSIMRKAADELTGARGSARELVGKRISGLRGARSPSRSRLRRRAPKAPPPC